MIKVVVWVEVDGVIADDPNWRSIFQAQAEKRAKTLGIQLGPTQVDKETSPPGKALLYWNEMGG